MEKFEKAKSNRLAASTLPVTPRPREGAGSVHISDGAPPPRPVLPTGPGCCPDSAVRATLPAGARTGRASPPASAPRIPGRCHRPHGLGLLLCLHTCSPRGRISVSLKSQVGLEVVASLWEGFPTRPGCFLLANFLGLVSIT